MLRLDARFGSTARNYACKCTSSNLISCLYLSSVEQIEIMEKCSNFEMMKSGPEFFACQGLSSLEGNVFIIYSQRCVEGLGSEWSPGGVHPVWKKVGVTEQFSADYIDNEEL